MVNISEDKTELNDKISKQPFDKHLRSYLLASYKTLKVHKLQWQNVKTQIKISQCFCLYGIINDGNMKIDTFKGTGTIHILECNYTV